MNKLASSIVVKSIFELSPCPGKSKNMHLYSLQNDSLKVSKETLMNITKENMSFNFEEVVNGIPAMILAGEREKGIMKKSALKTTKYIKDSKYYIVKGAGHGIPYENPEIFNRLLINFFSSNNITDFEGLICNSFNLMKVQN